MMASRDGGSSGRGRDSAQAVMAARTAAAAQPAHPAQVRRRSPTERAAGSTRVGTAPLRCVPLPESASLNSRADPQRSAGSFCSAVRIALSAAGETVGRLALSAGGCSVRTLATMACELGPVKGGSPASIS